MKSSMADVTDSSDFRHCEEMQVENASTDICEQSRFARHLYPHCSASALDPFDDAIAAIGAMRERTDAKSMMRR